MQRNKRIWVGTLSLLFLYLMLAFSMPFTAWPIVWIIGDKLDWESKRLAGWNAKNCGRIAVDEDAKTSSECIVKAVQDKKPFRVRYGTMAVDEASAIGIVGDRDGHVYHISFLGGSPDGGVSLVDQSITIWRCPEPIKFHSELDWGRNRGRNSCRELRPIESR
jgi:hypothetical protein